MSSPGFDKYWSADGGSNMCTVFMGLVSLAKDYPKQGDACSLPPDGPTNTGL